MLTTYEPTLAQMDAWLHVQTYCRCQQSATQAVTLRLQSGKYRTHLACAACGEKLFADPRSCTRVRLSGGPDG